MPFPQLPEDLTTLSDEELAELEAQFVAAFQEASPNARTPEQVAELSGLADATDAIRAEGAARIEAAAALAEQVAALSLRVVGQDDHDDDGDADEEDDEPDERGAPPAEPAGPAEVEPGTAPANPTPAANPETGEAPAPTARAAAGRPTLAAMAARVPARMAPRSDLAAVGRVRVTASPDIPGYAMGQQFNSLDDVAAAIQARRQNMGHGTPGGAGDGDNIPIARFTLDIPEERQFSRADPAHTTMAKIEKFKTVPSLVAAGGLCAPVAGYYEQFVIAEAMRPVRDALPTFGAERGGIRFNPPPKISQVTQGIGLVTAAQDSGGNAFTDGATNTNTTVTSATAAFTAADIGRTISGTGIPIGTTIVAVGSATSVTISQAATATATGVTITIGRGSKATFVASCPAISETDVQAVYSSIEFPNWTARTFPEVVAAWTKIAASVWARTADQALLDGIATNSTAVTSAGLVGGAREVLARLGQAAAGYRSRNRMAADAPLTVLAPQWLPDMMQADLARTFTDDPDLLGVTRGIIEAFLAARNINVSWYADSKTGGNQVVAAQAAGVLDQFPSVIYLYMFAEGSFIRLDAGTLDLGLVRDSVLNAQNRYRLFQESWEAVAFVGVESLEVALTAYPDGSYGPALAVTRPIAS